MKCVHKKNYKILKNLIWFGKNAQENRAHEVNEMKNDKLYFEDEHIIWVILGSLAIIIGCPLILVGIILLGR